MFAAFVTRLECYHLAALEIPANQSRAYTGRARPRQVVEQAVPPRVPGAAFKDHGARWWATAVAIVSLARRRLQADPDGHR
eukprot:10609255-Lingulodinium_polyedra.AAC.1